MRRGVCLAMGILFVVTVVSGIAELHVHPGQSGLHTVAAVLLVTITLIHVIINRKAISRYFTVAAANKTN
jgi:hypothetical protein